MKNNFFLLLFSLLFCNLILGQGIRLASNKYSDLAERLSVLYGTNNNYSTSLRNYDAPSVNHLGYENFTVLSPSDRKNFIDLINQYDHKKITAPKKSEIEKVDSFFYKFIDDDQEYFSDELYKSQDPILKYFYKNVHHFISLDDTNFKLRADPIVQISGGNASNDSNLVFQNTRGLELSATIDNKVYLYTRILENQQNFLRYVDDYVLEYNSLPENGSFKPYTSSIFKKLKGYDFLNAQAYIGLPVSKSIALELGHGKHFIGNGYRSLLLSDFSNNYFYLKFNTRVWKLNYQNLFAELNSNGRVGGDMLLPKKYMACHYLSIRPFKEMELGVFETVVFSRENQFELQYLNPVILYRMVEQLLGSSDNALLGLNANLTIKNKILLYGQLLIDEFNLAEAKKEGWWGNKYGIQAGMKYFNSFNIDQLDLQLEFNMARPYTYSHDRPENKPNAVTSYSHYNLPLAHPLGSNFREFIFKFNYRGLPKITFDGVMGMMSIGRDKNGANFGSNILINNSSRIMEYNNSILQGERNDILFLRLNASWEIFTNYKLFVNPQFRSSKSNDLKYQYNNLYLGGGITINLDLDKNIY